MPPAVWRQEWVVHLQHAGTGERVLDYLARYVFRIAIVNSRLERYADGHVTFRYRDGRTGTLTRCTLDALAFLDRFLQHVLPHGFAKVRHYGLFAPRRHPLLEQARAQLVAAPPSPSPNVLPPTDTQQGPRPPEQIPSPRRCPFCGIGALHVVETLSPWNLPP